MSNATYRAFPEKLGATDPTQFVGDKGELFWDPENANVSISDGETPGGIGLKTRNLEALESNRDASQWVTVFGNLSSDWKGYYGSGSAVDSNGFLWVTGGYDGVGHRATLSVFESDGQLDGNWRFYDDNSDTDYQFGEAIAIHKDAENGDSLYVAITTEDVVDEIVIAKIDLDTNTKVWARELDGSDSERAADIITDAAGNIYVVGSTRSDGAGDRDAFIAKLNPNGTLQWKQTFGGVNWERGEALAVDANYLYVVGQTTSEGEGGSDIFVAKLTQGSDTVDPTVVWQKTIGIFDSSSWEFGYGIAVGTTGNIYITGEAYDPEINNSHSVYLAKLTSAGAITWQKYLADYDYSRGSALVLDEEENVYLSGYADVDYAEETQTIAPKYEDLIIAKITSAGELKWQKSFGTKYGDYSRFNYGNRSITIDGEYVYVTGYTYNINRDEPNGFVAKFRTDGEFDGVYGDFVAQDILFDFGDTNLVMGTSELILNDAGDIDLNNPGSDFEFQSYGIDDRTSIRSPYEIRVRGVLAADTILTRDLSVNGVPFTGTSGNDKNICIGEGGGSNHNGAAGNVYLGYLAGFRNTDGNDNIFVGKYAGNRNTTGDNNVAIGRNSGLTATGNFNTFVGSYSADDQTTGDYNVVLGYNVGVANTSGSTQLAVGSNGGYWLRGDSSRNVTVPTPGASLKLTSPNGTEYALTIDDSGNLNVGINTVVFVV
jgi:hypothetical protein